MFPNNNHVGVSGLPWVDLYDPLKCSLIRFSVRSSVVKTLVLGCLDGLGLS